MRKGVLIGLPGKDVQGNKPLRRRCLSGDWNVVKNGAVETSQWRAFRAEGNQGKDSAAGVCLMWWGRLKKPVCG